VTTDSHAPPLLSVVVPVFNQAASIVGNLGIIREKVAAELGEPFEMVVVSDGSIDTTEQELLEQAPEGTYRVFHYDRNLGKGYAVKLGALEARGAWIGFVDADLDLDPADLAVYVRRAQAHDLDFAIGSKRHPDSQVDYPPVRVVASWFFQQLVRLLFRLDVRDTQVGLKVFRREVAEQVLPLLLVKRYAFDIELLAVGRAFGFERVEEMPIRLDYQFTGSGVRSRAVLRALIDTAAVFYRLRILHYYQRRRAIVGPYGWTRPRSSPPIVSVIRLPGVSFQDREYGRVELLDAPDDSPAAIWSTARAAAGEVLLILERDSRPAGNLLSATIPFFARPEIAAVVVPKMAPLTGTHRARAAAAIDESRVGAGLGYFRFTPGNVRFVDEFPARSLAVRRDVFLTLGETALPDVVRQIAAGGRRVLYTPESVVVVEPPPLFVPHLAAVFARGRRGWLALRRNRTSAVATLALLGIVAAAGVFLSWTDTLGAVAVIYLVAVGVAAASAAFRFQSIAVSGLVVIALPCTHAAYAAGFVRGLAGSGT
jgi:glycosyltransferase involved in cell wall biosynthesis